MYTCHYYNQDLLLMVKGKTTEKHRQIWSTLKIQDKRVHNSSRLQEEQKELEHKQVEFKLGEDC